MKVCCDVFNELVADAGNRGYSVVACVRGSYRFFCLQARACPKLDEPKMKNLPKGIDIPNPLTVGMQIGIQYCPFCGTKLANIIAGSLNEFTRLADSNKPLLLGP
jgi:hypothetical protein